jgi:hypothetical protein
MTFQPVPCLTGALALCLLAMPAAAGGDPDYRNYGHVPSYKDSYTYQPPVEQRVYQQVPRQRVYQQPSHYTPSYASYPSYQQYYYVYPATTVPTYHYGYSYPSYRNSNCNCRRRRCR